MNLIGYRTHQRLRRHARQHQREERRGMELIGLLASLAGAVLMILAGVLIADYITGLEVVSSALQQAMQ